MLLRIIVILLLTITNFNTASYGIVRHDKVEDKLYIDLAKSYTNIVKIETDNSFGSAVMLDNQTLITSAHNVKNKKNIKVIINYVEYIPYNIVFHDGLDLAILKIRNLHHKINTINFYQNILIDQNFIIVGYGFTGTGLTGATLRDFKKRAGYTRCTELKKNFAECLFDAHGGYDLSACVAQGDSGGGVFKDEKLVGIITYVTGKGGDGKGDSTYGDKTAFIPITDDIIEWIKTNL